jgi:hypothetical protein
LFLALPFENREEHGTMDPDLAEEEMRLGSLMVRQKTIQKIRLRASEIV